MMDNMPGNKLNRPENNKSTLLLLLLRLDFHQGRKTWSETERMYFMDAEMIILILYMTLVIEH